MQLNFTTHIKGKPNYFVQKIWEGLSSYYSIAEMIKEHYLNSYYWVSFEEKTNAGGKKIHTIREDKNNRFKPGLNLHLVVFPYQKGKRLQFTPIIKCISTQQIIIKYFYNGKTEQFDLPTVLIDGKEIKGKQLLALSNNDGFDTVEDFFAYFKTDFTGKIIHWTNFKY